MVVLHSHFRGVIVKSREDGSAKGIAKESIVKVIDLAPETVIAVGTFGNETVNVRIPF